MSDVAPAHENEGAPEPNAPDPPEPPEPPEPIGAPAPAAAPEAAIKADPARAERSGPSAAEPDPALAKASDDPPTTLWAASPWILVATAFSVLVADLASKEWVLRNIAGPDFKRSAKHVVLWAGHLDLIFAQNPGGAWSFLRSLPDNVRRPFFLFVSSAAIVFIVGVYRRLDRRQWAMRWGLPLALGGALGNLADRIRHGWVVDFIDVFYKGDPNELHWPTFNVADIAIVVGVLLMAVDIFTLRRHAAIASAPPKTEARAAG